MQVTKPAVLGKIKELLALNTKTKSIGADTLLLIFKIPHGELMTSLLALEQEGQINLYSTSTPKKETSKQIFMIELMP